MSDVELGFEGFLDKYWWKLVRVERFEVGKNLGFWSWENMCKVKREGGCSGFIFSGFRGHAAAWMKHAAAWLKNTGVVQGCHAAAQGLHAAACCSREFVWGLGMPRHKENMLRHDFVFCTWTWISLLHEPNMSLMDLYTQKTQKLCCAW